MIGVILVEVIRALSTTFATAQAHCLISRMKSFGQGFAMASKIRQKHHRGVNSFDNKRYRAISNCFTLGVYNCLFQ